MKEYKIFIYTIITLFVITAILFIVRLFLPIPLYVVFMPIWAPILAVCILYLFILTTLCIHILFQKIKKWLH